MKIFKLTTNQFTILIFDHSHHDDRFQSKFHQARRQKPPKEIKIFLNIHHQVFPLNHVGFHEISFDICLKAACLNHYGTLSTHK